MKYLFLLFLFVPLSSYAEEPWHMVSFGSDGIGLTASNEDINTKGNSPFTRVIYYFADLGLNYAYRVSSRIQIGAKYSSVHREYRLRSKAGGHSSVEIEELNIGGFAVYNFSNDLNDSWYAGYGYSVIQYEEENSEAFQDAEGKGPFEFDDASSRNEIFVGKRFSLRGFKMENFTYSPQISLYHQTHAKDFKDNRIGNGEGFIIQPIRFDLLF